MFVCRFQASFTATKKGDDIDIDDPDFWKKWAMKADIDVDELMNKVDWSWIFKCQGKRGQAFVQGNAVYIFFMYIYKLY